MADLNEAFRSDLAKEAVRLYGVHYLPELRVMTPEARNVLLREANEINTVTPLHLNSGPHRLDAWPKPLSGLELITLMVFGLFVQMGERRDLCSPLLRSWPIEDVLDLVDGPTLLARRFEPSAEGGTLYGGGCFFKFEPVEC